MKMRATLALALAVAGLPALGVTAAASASAPAASASASAAMAEDVVSVPVTFDVVNQNRSAVPCGADGGTYEMAGHITGPADALAGDAISAATLYLHGNGVDERLWRYQAAPAYDYAAAMGRQGFVSVTVTRLGYSGSGMPHGDEVCFGSEADVAHQVIEHLRAGTYGVPADSPLGADGAARVQKLALAGHSASGFVAMAEAYSFRDIDALIVVASGEFTSPRVPQVLLGMRSRCATEGDGYALLTASDDEAAADFFHDGEPAVVADAVTTRPADACGGTANAPASIAVDLASLGTVTVPVLTISGEDDAYFPDPAAQATLFTGSDDVQAISLPDTGHAITLERSAPAFRFAIAGWLRERGLAVR